MIFSIKHVLIFGSLLTGVLLYGVLAHQKTALKDDLIPLEERYSDDELVVYETVYNTCITDIKNTYKAESHIIVLTCQCVAKRVLKNDTEIDNDLKLLYKTSKQDCYEITLKHIGKD